MAALIFTTIVLRIINSKCKKSKWKYFIKASSRWRKVVTLLMNGNLMASLMLGAHSSTAGWIIQNHAALKIKEKKKEQFMASCKAPCSSSCPK